MDALCSVQEKKRFIECSHVFYTGAISFGAISVAEETTYVDRHMIKTLSYKKIRRINGYVIPEGWYINHPDLEKHSLRIANDQDALDFIKDPDHCDSGFTGITNAILHLTRELSYSPGLVHQGSEYLQAEARQRDHFENKDTEN